MFVTHIIISVFELLFTSIYSFTDFISKNSNSFITSCVTMHDSYCLFTLTFSNDGEQYFINLHYLILPFHVLLRLLLCLYILCMFLKNNICK